MRPDQLASPSLRAGEREVVRVDLAAQAVGFDLESFGPQADYGTWWLTLTSAKQRPITSIGGLRSLFSFGFGAYEGDPTSAFGYNRTSRFAPDRLIGLHPVRLTPA